MGYNQTIDHFSASATVFSVCSVEPGTAIDVARVLKIIGDLRVPFGIKGGGHSYNPNFSSTTGILIAMVRFREITYNGSDETVTVGAGLIWDEVYDTLYPLNRTVVGGRCSGVGVAGLSLGGGYSYKSNQYGLTIDNIFEYELITPNATVVYVNNISYPDIFFGLKGGLNNFGIVSKFKMRAVPQTQVYGGLLTYGSSQIDASLQALSNFSANTMDSKAMILATLNISQNGFFLLPLFFYDAPIVSNGVFNEFTNIQFQGTLETRSYPSLIKALLISKYGKLRSRLSFVAVTRLNVGFLQTIKNRLLYYNSTLGFRPGASFSLLIEPFISTYLDTSQSGAYPHVSSAAPLLPLGIQFNWLLPSDDNVFLEAIKSMTNDIYQAALGDGQDVGGSKQIIYPNYALEDTPVEGIYGNNLARLQSIRKAWDPQNIMYLTGGFKL